MIRGILILSCLSVCLSVVNFYIHQWNPNPVGPSDMTDENCFGPAENISFPDRMSGNVFSDNELKKCPKRFNIKNTISQIVFSCGFIFDSREQTFGTIFLLPYVHDRLYCMKSPMFKTRKWIGFLFATSYMGVWSKRPKSETAQTKTAQIGYQNGPTFLLHNYDR